jgi:hypothetical protein
LPIETSCIIFPKRSAAELEEHCKNAFRSLGAEIAGYAARFKRLLAHRFLQPALWAEAPLPPLFF